MWNERGAHCSALTQYSTWSLLGATRQAKEMKGIQTGKEEIKFSLHVNMILKDLEDSIRKLLDTINSFSIVE